MVFSISFLKNYRFIFHKFTFWFTLIAPALIFLFISWATDLIDVHDSKQMIELKWGVMSPNGYVFPFFIFWFELLSIISLGIIIYVYRSTKDKLQKEQAKLIIFALLVPLVFGSLTDGILPIFNIYLFQSAVPLTSVMAITIMYAIYKYGLFEVSKTSILANIQEGIITTDNHGNIIDMNLHAQKVIGYEFSYVNGKPIEQILHLKSGNRKVSIPPLYHKTNSQESVYNLLDKEGKEYPIELTLTPIISGKSTIAFNFVFRDVSRQQIRERLKDDFASYVAHELKTPLTSLKAYTQILRRYLKKKDTEKARQVTLSLEYQINRMNRLISDFLDLSRIESKKLHLQKSKIFLHDLIIEVIDIMKSAHPKRKILLQGDANNFIYADHDRIVQVLINLISNAIKFSSANKSVIVQVHAHRMSVVIGIKDFGMGIKPEDKKKIFERFYQGIQNPGLGMGLYISSAIIKQHNGRIWLKSILNKGSTFYISLPLQK